MHIILISRQSEYKLGALARRRRRRAGGERGGGGSIVHSAWPRFETQTRQHTTYKLPHPPPPPPGPSCATKNHTVRATKWCERPESRERETILRLDHGCLLQMDSAWWCPGGWIWIGRPYSNASCFLVAETREAKAQFTGLLLPRAWLLSVEIFRIIYILRGCAVCISRRRARCSLYVCEYMYRRL